MLDIRHLTALVRYRTRPGVLVEDIGSSWAAFSPYSGETHLLNDEAAALLEILDVPRTVVEIGHQLALDGVALVSASPHALAGGVVVLEATGLIESV